jgi:hypothetical protein
MTGRRNMNLIGSIIVLGAAALLCGGAGSALAQKAETAKPTPPKAAVPGNDADCTIYEIEASNAAPAVDKALAPIAKKLKKAPFSSWKTFKLLKKHEKRVTRMTALRQQLVTGSKLTLLYRDKSVAGPTNKTRLRLKFTLDDKNDKRKLDSTINVDSGDHSLIGGDELKGGATYILGVSCKAL